MCRVQSPRRPTRPATYRPRTTPLAPRAAAEGMLRELAYVFHLVERVREEIVNDPAARSAAVV
jgi:hypothetical protein